MDGYIIRLDFVPDETGCGGFILPTQKGFYIVGCNVKFMLLPSLRAKGKPELIRYEEGRFENGAWKRGRVLNGDERWELGLGNAPSIRYIEVKCN